MILKLTLCMYYTSKLLIIFAVYDALWHSRGACETAKLSYS
jgi:hypothetical protein